VASTRLIVLIGEEGGAEEGKVVLLAMLPKLKVRNGLMSASPAKEAVVIPGMMITRGVPVTGV
jgi:hypothetical protein